jgi:hypothetical protein
MKTKCGTHSPQARRRRRRRRRKGGMREAGFGSTICSEITVRKMFVGAGPLDNIYN